jgi:phospholipid/cholesterol/gamma-HCH transport system substrate-binding protein
MNETESPIARWAALGALLVAILIVLILLFAGGDGGNRYRLLFENGGQLVEGNEVRIGGVPVGTVETLDLSEDNQAEVTIETEEALHQGTSAVVRTTYLSGIANRYISITPGPNDAPELEDGDVITQAQTTSPVDLDQLFDTFRPRARRALAKVIQGQAAVYSGRGPEANRAYKFLSPGLSSTKRLFAELTRDQEVFTDFVVDTGALMNAIAARRDDLSALVANTNQALGAAASQNEALDRSLAALPPALRQANTTFVNLRATLDDLDPFVTAAKPATRNLAPFLRDLRPVAERSVPVFRDLGRAVKRRGPQNDLADLLRDTPQFERNTRSAVGPAIDALQASQPNIEFARPYTPDLMALVTKLGQATAYYDANGHYARVHTADLGIFDYDPATGELDPQPSSERYEGLDFESDLTPCPGAATQPALDGSSPFLDDGRLAGDCDPADGPPAP